MRRLGQKWRRQTYKIGVCKTCIILTCSGMSRWFMEEGCNWWLNIERFSSIWLYWIRLKYLSFEFKIGRNNLETPNSRGYHSRSKRISWRNYGFTTRRRVSWRRSHWWTKKICIANGNENEKGETNGHNDDSDAINLSNAKDLKKTV